MDGCYIYLVLYISDKVTDLERFKYVCAWLDTVSRLINEDLRARTPNEAGNFKSMKACDNNRLGPYFILRWCGYYSVGCDLYIKQVPMTKQ